MKSIQINSESIRTVKEPDRIARLGYDKRGYPIPWNVLIGNDGTPIFTINDDRRHRQAIREALCPICGERLGRWKVWIGGPQSAFREFGWYQDLPSHRDCARFALQTCPYLATPHYLGRIDVPDPSKLPSEARLLIDHTQIPGRPVLFVALTGDKVEIQDNGPVALPYTRPLRPVADYEFWQHGRQLTLAEALPVLRGALGEGWTPPALQESP